MASQTFSSWRARPGCPEYLRTHLECLVNGFPAAWLAPPASGEVFENILECEKRLIGYSLAEGFDVVRNGGGTTAIPAKLGRSKRKRVHTARYEESKASGLIPESREAHKGGGEL